MIFVNQNNIEISGNAVEVLSEVALALRKIKNKYDLEDTDIEEIAKIANMSSSELKVTAIKSAITDIDNIFVSSFMHFMETEDCNNCNACEDCEMLDLYNRLKDGSAGANDLLNFTFGENKKQKSRKPQNKCSGDLFSNMFDDLL